ncbi:hypothetical protein F5050DRAFT_1713558 [Lentinula boryana]|uniref:Uncharacterized protein n=1 Tax=Lentinula boryana TaxID=40481 RepID=A0ABQ8Q814_9AGAR|nr:hypothetical protein F5050DRAFT_1713558 [Lentinula boryana]
MHLTAIINLYIALTLSVNATPLARRDASAIIVASTSAANGLLGGILAESGDALDSVVPTVGSVADNVIDDVGDAADGITVRKRDSILSGITGIADGAVSTGEGVVDGTVSTAESVTDGAVGAIESAAESATNSISSILGNNLGGLKRDSIIGTTTGILDGVGNDVTNVAGGLTGAAVSAASGIADGAGSVLGGVTSVYLIPQPRALNEVGGSVDSAVGGLDSTASDLASAGASAAIGSLIDFPPGKGKEAQSDFGPRILVVNSEKYFHSHDTLSLDFFVWIWAVEDILHKVKERTTEFERQL